MTIDPTDLSPGEVHKLLIGTVVPRPIAWLVSRIDGDRYNAAPFSYFNAVSSRPAVLSTVFSHKQGDPEGIKDSLRNIRRHGEYSINSVAPSQIDAMNDSATDFPAEESEIDRLGITTLPCDIVDGVRIADSAVSYECRLLKEISIGDGPGGAVLVLSEILRVHIKDGIIDDGLHVDIGALNPLARLAGNDFAQLGAIMSRERAKYRDDEMTNRR